LVSDVEKRQAGRLLIVDDENALLVVMEQYLRRLGYEVAACRSGREAWELFETQPAAYALVLADITMPEMSGQEMLLRMLRLNPAIRILICSGYPFDVASLPVTVRQHIGFLQKPFTPRMLADTVEQLLAARGGAQPA
jgi:CheY-like chemotaxis protein